MSCADRIAVDSHLEEGIQPGALQDGIAVLARSDDGDFEPVLVQLADELDASFVTLHPAVVENRVEQIILAVSEPADGFGQRGSSASGSVSAWWIYCAMREKSRTVPSKRGFALHGSARSRS
jgi:hypothetical protein